MLFATKLRCQRLILPRDGDGLNRSDFRPVGDLNFVSGHRFGDQARRLKDNPGGDFPFVRVSKPGYGVSTAVPFSVEGGSTPVFGRNQLYCSSSFL